MYEQAAAQAWQQSWGFCLQIFRYPAEKGIVRCVKMLKHLPRTDCSQSTLNSLSSSGSVTTLPGIRCSKKAKSLSETQEKGSLCTPYCSLVSITSLELVEVAERALLPSRLVPHRMGDLDTDILGSSASFLCVSVHWADALVHIAKVLLWQIICHLGRVQQHQTERSWTREETVMVALKHKQRINTQFGFFLLLPRPPVHKMLDFSTNWPATIQKYGEKTSSFRE